MKIIKIVAILFLIGTLELTTSCYKEEMIEPVIEGVTLPSTVVVRESFDLTLRGEAEFFAVWPGDTTHKYTETPLNYNTGIEMSESEDEENLWVANYRYIFPGTYTVVFIGSSTGDFGNEFEQVTETRTITVTEE